MLLYGRRLIKEEPKALQSGRSKGLEALEPGKNAQKGAKSAPVCKKPLKEGPKALQSGRKPLEKEAKALQSGKKPLKEVTKVLQPGK
ncbi:hypothetical protein U1P98_12635 [Lysinibacillus irui]|uniref:Uncharacterized protein n=1 Tax=Lysinibacillus irui TaxID=2998077 RepID=A0ABU5NM89_9BACI|nr:hypothetical protein [Lysinibacillus irui]MEA0555564.1 hypothetical protein [Lysinibacillus irui]MEA0977149.1 hypothetical protein [Lysinibacillus irui]MEA1043303.1 hypothetical protein [Lysinibacillus irui]